MDRAAELCSLLFADTGLILPLSCDFSIFHSFARFLYNF